MICNTYSKSKQSNCGIYKVLSVDVTEILRASEIRDHG